MLNIGEQIIVSWWFWFNTDKYEQWDSLVQVGFYTEKDAYDRVKNQNKK